ncbi:MAG: hypothetical protein FJY82_12045 [Candidatus Aminicenantes bacterium]|nr:hypothetical protein [Candidatus Aminicenantes bacterium]
MVEVFNEEESELKEIALSELEHILHLHLDSLNKSDLKKWAAGGGFQALRDRLRDPRAGMRDEALILLTRLADEWVIGQSQVVDLLIEALKDENLQVRGDAACGLQRLTEKDLGLDYEAWKSWRDEEGRS